MQQNYRLVLVVDEDYKHNGPEKKIVEGIRDNMPGGVEVHVVKAPVSLAKRINVVAIKRLNKRIEALITNNTVVMPMSCTIGYEIKELVKKHRTTSFVGFFVDCSSYGVYSTLKNASGNSIHISLGRRLKETYRMLVWFFKESALLKLYPKVLFITPKEIEHARMIHKKISSDMSSIRFALDNIPEKSFKQHNYEKEITIGILTTFGYSTYDAIIRWFLENCQREIISSYPNIRVVIAGRNASPSQVTQMEQYSFVSYIGEVNNLLDFYNTVDLIVSADLREVGIFTKVVEAFSYGKCVVGFRKNFAPIEGAVEYSTYIPADTAEEFRNVFGNIMSGKIDVDMVGNNARKLIEEKFRWQSSCAELDEFIRK